MRLTVIKDDGFVSVDSEGYSGIDLSSLDNNINAIQWYGTYGDIEIRNERNQIVSNIEINNIDEYMFIVDLWNQKKLDMVNNENRSEAELPIE